MVSPGGVDKIDVAANLHTIYADQDDEMNELKVIEGGRRILEEKLIKLLFTPGPVPSDEVEELNARLSSRANLQSAEAEARVKFRVIEGSRKQMEQKAYEAFLENDFKAFFAICSRMDERARLNAVTGEAPGGPRSPLGSSPRP